MCQSMVKNMVIKDHILTRKIDHKYISTRLLFTIQVRPNDEAPKREQVMKPAEAGSDGPSEPRKVKDKVGRNDPCPCGSGKKYKKCCGMDLK